MRDRLLRLFARPTPPAQATVSPGPASPALAFETELTAWLRSRDPGVAPIKLHLDVAKVTDVRPPRLSLGRIAVAFSATAAVLALLAALPAFWFVPALPLPAASQAVPDPSVESSWPALGPVLAIPESVALAALLVAAALVLVVGLHEVDALAIAKAIRDRSTVAPSRRRFGRLRRWLAVLITPCLLVGLNIPLGTATAEPLGFGGLSGGLDPRLLGDRPSTFNGANELEFAYAPGAEIRTEFSLFNGGDQPVTVLSLPWQPDSVFESVTLLLPPSRTEGGVATYPDQGRPWASEPFRPFVLQPHEFESMVLSIHLRDCRGQAAMAVPTATASDQGPFNPYLPPADSKLAHLADVPVVFSYAGIERMAQIRLAQVVTVVGIPGAEMGC